MTDTTKLTQTDIDQQIALSYADSACQGCKQDILAGVEPDCVFL